MSSDKLNKALKPLKWLIGNWRSVEAKRANRDLKVKDFCASIKFEDIGVSALNYHLDMWDPEEKREKLLGRGFLKPKKDSNQVALINAHTLGLVSIEEGCVSENCLQVVSTKVTNISFTSQSPITKIQRVIKMEEGKLILQICLASEKHKELYEYFKGKFTKDDDEK